MVGRISAPWTSAAGGGLLSPLVALVRARTVAKHVVGRRVVDCGCGHGYLSSFLGAGQIYVGIDRDAMLVESLRLRYPSRFFYCLDLDESDLPGPDEVDTFVLAAVIEHLQRPLEVIQRLVAKLRVGGRLVLTTPDPVGAPFLSLGAKLGLLSRAAREEHKRLFDRGELLDLLMTAGLSPISYQRFLVGLNQIVVAKR